MSLVSIIIPNYNHAQFLERRIDNVLNQSYENINVIILDDASNDNSQEIINSYKNHRQISHIIFNESNSGSPFIQWRKGLELATGKYVWIAESDDYSKPDFLEKCIRVLEEEESLALAFCDTVAVDSNDQKLSVGNNRKLSDRYNAIEDNFFYNWFFLNDSFRILNASSCVFRRSYVNERILEECPQFKFAGDKFFWFNLISEHPLFYYIAEPLNYQRYHNNTTRARHGVLSEYQRNQELSIIYADYRKLNLPLDKPAYREIGKRIVATNLYGIFLFKFPNLVKMFKGMAMVGIDIKYYKKILKTILTDKNH